MSECSSHLLDHPLLQEEVVTFEQIADWPLILRGGMTLTRSMLESEFKRRGLSYEVLVELDGMDIIKRYVALGMGISVGPRLAIEPEDERTLGIVNLANLLPIEQAGILTLRGRNAIHPGAAIHSSDEGHSHAPTVKNVHNVRSARES